jgi:hypothetical protein
MQTGDKGLDEEEAQEVLLTKVRGKEPLPHIIPTWFPSEKFLRDYDTGGRHRSWILVLPEECRTWEDVEEKGLLSVKFDLDVTPMMEIYAASCYGDDLEDSLLDEEKQGYVEVEKSHLEKLPPVETTAVCV